MGDEEIETKGEPERQSELGRVEEKQGEGTTEEGGWVWWIWKDTVRMKENDLGKKQ